MDPGRFRVPPPFLHFFEGSFESDSDVTYTTECDKVMDVVIGVTKDTIGCYFLLFTPAKELRDVESDHDILLREGKFLIRIAVKHLSNGREHYIATFRMSGTDSDYRGFSDCIQAFYDTNIIVLESLTKGLEVIPIALLDHLVSPISFSGTH
jgi:hypothetical protein